MPVNWELGFGQKINWELGFVLKINWEPLIYIAFSLSVHLSVCEVTKKIIHSPLICQAVY